MRRDSGTVKNLNGVTYADGTFVAVGKSGTILTSLDGRTWTIRRSGGTADLDAVARGSQSFVAVSDNGTILTSPDGIKWTCRRSGVPNLRRVAWITEPSWRWRRWTRSRAKVPS